MPNFKVIKCENEIPEDYRLWRALPETFVTQAGQPVAADYTGRQYRLISRERDYTYRQLLTRRIFAVATPLFVALIPLILNRALNGSLSLSEKGLGIVLGEAGLFIFFGKELLSLFQSTIARKQFGIPINASF